MAGTFSITSVGGLSQALTSSVGPDVGRSEAHSACRTEGFDTALRGALHGDASTGHAGEGFTLTATQKGLG